MSFFKFLLLSYLISFPLPFSFASQVYYIDLCEIRDGFVLDNSYSSMLLSLVYGEKAALKTSPRFQISLDPPSVQGGIQYRCIGTTLKELSLMIDPVEKDSLLFKIKFTSRHHSFLEPFNLEYMKRSGFSEISVSRKTGQREIWQIIFKSKLNVGGFKDRFESFLDFLNRWPEIANDLKRKVTSAPTELVEASVAPPSYDLLPLDIRRLILPWLSFGSMRNLAVVGKKWNRLVHEYSGPISLPQYDSNNIQILKIIEFFPKITSLYLWPDFNENVTPAVLTKLIQLPNLVYLSILGFDEKWVAKLESLQRNGESFSRLNFLILHFIPKNFKSEDMEKLPLLFPNLKEVRLTSYWMDPPLPPLGIRNFVKWKNLKKLYIGFHVSPFDLAFLPENLESLEFDPSLRKNLQSTMGLYPPGTFRNLRPLVFDSLSKVGE